jgi:glycosyltransferase involved in cell wall biosynthesis
MMSSQVPQYVLSNYPLSAPYRARVEKKLGAQPVYVTVSELRQSSFMRLFGRLRSLRGPHLSIAIEDESSLALATVLKLLGGVSRCKELKMLDPALAESSFGRREVLQATARLCLASVKSLLALLRSVAELRALKGKDRILCEAPKQGHVAYLNCNLWFGVKAGGSVGHISGVANALMDLSYELQFFSVGGKLMVDSRASFVPLRAPAMLSMPFETTYYQFQRDCVAQIQPALARATGFLYQRMSIANYTGVILSRKFGLPLVLEYNGSEAWVAKNWGRPLRFHSAAVLAEDVCLKHAHVVVTISDVLGEELKDRGVDPERIVVYPNCIDPKIFDPARFADEDRRALKHKLGLMPDDLVATFIGTFGQWHGVDVLALAIRKMMQEKSEFLRKYRVRFVLVGDGVKMPQVRQTLDLPETAEFVRLTGLVPQPEAPSYLAASDVLLSPHVANSDGTAFFGSPTKLFEYMAMGRGIYASDLDQIGTVLRDSLRVESLPAEAPSPTDSRLAVLGRPGNVDDVVRGIEFLVQRADWRSALARNVRAEALAKYTWDRHVGEILSALQRVVPARPTNRQ